MKYVIIAIFLIMTPPFVFSGVMESNGYKLELDPSDIGAIEGRGVPVEETDNGFTDIFLSSDNLDLWKIVLFFGIIIILIAFFIHNIKKTNLQKNKA